MCWFVAVINSYWSWFWDSLMRVQARKIFNSIGVLTQEKLSCDHRLHTHYATNQDLSTGCWLELSFCLHIMVQVCSFFDGIFFLHTSYLEQCILQLHHCQAAKNQQTKKPRAIPRLCMKSQLNSEYSDNNRKSRYSFLRDLLIAKFCSTHILSSKLSYLLIDCTSQSLIVTTHTHTHPHIDIYITEKLYHNHLKITWLWVQS